MPIDNQKMTDIYNDISISNEDLERRLEEAYCEGLDEKEISVWQMKSDTAEFIREQKKTQPDRFMKALNELKEKMSEENLQVSDLEDNYNKGTHLGRWHDLLMVRQPELKDNARFVSEKEMQGLIHNAYKSYRSRLDQDIRAIVQKAPRVSGDDNTIAFTQMNSKDREALIDLTGRREDIITDPRQSLKTMILDKYDEQMNSNVVQDFRQDIQNRMDNITAMTGKASGIGQQAGFIGSRNSGNVFLEFLKLVALMIEFLRIKNLEMKSIEERNKMSDAIADVCSYRTFQTPEGEKEYLGVSVGNDSETDIELYFDTDHGRVVCKTGQGNAQAHEFGKGILAAVKNAEVQVQYQMGRLGLPQAVKEIMDNEQELIADPEFADAEIQTGEDISHRLSDMTPTEQTGNVSDEQTLQNTDTVEETITSATIDLGA